MTDISPAAPARAFLLTGGEHFTQATRDAAITIVRRNGPRFVAHATCPMCGTAELGIEFHGELMSGAKVHQIAAHTPGMRRTQSGQPRCLGAGMRVELVGGSWRGVSK